VTTTSDREWSDLSLAWQRTDDPGTERLMRAAVIRRGRLMRIVLGSEVLVTVAVLGWVGYVVAARPTATMIGWGIAALLHSVLVWAFALWNRRGIWAPLGESTRDYLAVAFERASRDRRAAQFVVWLVTLEVVAIATFVALRHRPVSGGSWLVPAAVVVSALGWAIFRLLRSDRELAALRSVARELGFDRAPNAAGLG
jgi:hypothetical protein